MQQAVKTALAFTGVLMIWGTTPLAIQWSSSELHYLLSVSLRMGMAAVLAVVVVLLLEKRLPLNRLALSSYAAGSLGIYGGMLCVYWAAGAVPSGLISIIYGLAPVLTGVQAYYLLAEDFGPRKWMGALVSLSGLVLIFADSLQLGSIDTIAVGALLLSVLLFTLCSLLTKKVAAPVTPLQQTSGTLSMSAMAYVLSCAVLSPELPVGIGWKSGLSLLYLAGICSVLGFFLYFYVLKVSSAGSVALITLVSPVIALSLGVLLNGEVFSASLLAGGVLIGMGLVVYQWPAVKQLYASQKRSGVAMRLG